MQNTPANQRSLHPSIRLCVSRNLVRPNKVYEACGVNRSILLKRVAHGFWTRPVMFGPKVLGWLMSDVAALMAAQAANLSDTQVRLLVEQLERGRETLLQAGAQA